MSLQWKCIEPVTAIGCGWGAYAFGMLDGSIAVGSIIGGSALLRVFRESKAKFGLDSSSEIKKQKAAIRSAWEEKTKGSWLEEKDLIAADERLSELLPDCIPNAAELGSTVVNAKKYPDRAAEIILSNLASKAEIFRPDGQMGASATARNFAETVITASLNAALNNPEYTRQLIPHMLIDVGAGVARIEEAVNRNTELLEFLITDKKAEAAEKGINEYLLLTLAKRVTNKVDDPATAADYLHQALNRLQELEAEGQRGTNFGGHIDTIIAEIFDAIDDEDISVARDKGQNAFTQFKAQAEELSAAMETVANTNIQTALLDFDVDGALHWVLQKLALRHDGPPTLDTLRAEQDYWYELALKSGLRLEMDLSIALARHNIDIAANDQERAMCQNNLANALVRQGSRSVGEKGIKLFDEAVTAYRAALEVYKKNVVQTDWAGTQNNLGSALAEQGGRSGREKGIKLLDDAVTAFRAALEVYTKEDMFAERAMTQNNLGTALAGQGGCSDGEKGIKLLNDAVTAYRAALDVRTKKNMPTNWANTQNNLGVALRKQGSRSAREKGIKLLDDAVTAYRAALEVRTQIDMPADWAGTQNNLGNAFLAMTDLHQLSAEKIPCLEQAIEHYKNALTIYDPTNMPFHYDKTTKVLDKAKAELAALRGDGDGDGSIDA